MLNVTLKGLLSFLDKHSGSRGWGCSPELVDSLGTREALGFILSPGENNQCEMKQSKTGTTSARTSGFPETHMLRF